MKSLKPPSDGCLAVCAGLACGGGEVGASKKLPPPANEDAGFNAAATLELLSPLSRPANGDGLGACCVGCEKLKLAKASFMPPNPP
jgi:hypothetical protein